jgi:hypothetical protein
LPSSRVLERLEFHYVPKHVSWLNMVEIEIGVLRGQCLDRRIGTRQRLESEILAWERNEMQHAPASNECSPSTMHAQKWGAPIPAKPISGALNSKSHNHCAEVLVQFGVEPETRVVIHTPNLRDGVIAHCRALNAGAVVVSRDAGPPPRL